MDLLRAGPVSYSSAFSTFGKKREGGREGGREGQTEGKGREGKGREGKGREGKGREGKGRELRQGREETKEESIANYIINFPPACAE